MPLDAATRAHISALIQESRQVYRTEPVAAALMLYKGISGIKSSTGEPIKAQGQRLETLTHRESVLQTALWSLELMGEDAQAGIAPTPSEWDLNISIAESIARMMEAVNDPA